jgi:uncharacterized protein YciI
VSAFIVIREAGPAWQEGGIADQPALSDHATFMNTLADRHVVLAAGPLAGTELGRIRALLIINAEDEANIRRHLADDPWAISGQLRITSVEPWNVFVGAERINRTASDTM